MQDQQVARISPPPLPDAGGRGSDLAVTARELNAGAEPGKLLQPGEIVDARFTTLSTFLCFELRQTSGG